ncbi:RNA polymerase sigma factor [Brevibacillus reuszeri]|uniref:RNA polymerase sigma factor n=1 Tax=Brevibacillus reuszeri TaxID=54915 RepID=UPI003D23001F
MEEINLIKICQSGHIAAFELLLKKYEHKAMQTAYLITRQKELSEDIVQEAFIQCYNQLHTLRQPEYFRTWFYRILIRLSYRMVKKEKWKAFFSQKPVSDIGYSPRFEEKIAAKEMYQSLYESVNSLSEKLRTVVVLFYFNEMTTKEIADVLSVSEGTVKSRLHHARKRMQQTLQDKGYLSFEPIGRGEQTYVGNTVTEHAE